ncbi:hypothetical protein CCMSSC00406_0005957 [Pleurotus cornucopiae]|uniref:Uncharacterized protein n=1 Tax=Pleurotus cornucopiae TaxID=5321 RepID=A0ACB7IK63_PLECO|nr:hypothetical protein CCMSSC00406_0005957 [Pleurotus cornucopiae]
MVESQWLARWPVNPDDHQSVTYTPEQEILMVSLLPEYIVTEPRSEERKQWRARLEEEWIARWPLTSEHKRMFSTWFRNHAESLGYGKAAAHSHRRPANGDDEMGEARAGEASGSVIKD